ncbi:hypothetical protein [Candidatus Reidiella endopervernicosa]|uniref:Uncharacterized protein n=2 Tax=Gammaproteobacteria incertae sedis TaxID=118884 RepID=A0A6N0HW25_9GAMM|nr:hypothetical protein [Candidatus Reidiella endopervernicosa]QKQ26563.1 hypothetical protein HUE57_09915 [Candidatus Reidiella endopervernicosa]
MKWEQLDAFWAQLRAVADDSWYIYAVGEAPPEQTVSADKLIEFITEIDTLLRKDHQESYCAIVYADDLEKPSYVKIFDPHNLGVSCGFSDNPPLPGWILSRIKPCDLNVAMPPPGGRRCLPNARPTSYSYAPYRSEQSAPAAP